MPQILRTIAMRNRVIAAAGEVNQIDLPVNPLSAIIITIKALNNDAVNTNYDSLLAFFAKFTNFNVRYRGATIIDGASDDLAVITNILTGWQPKQGQIDNVDNDVRALTFALCFGSKPYDPLQCFPATRRGDLVFSWTAVADAASGLDNFLLAIETVELLDAQPKSFYKVTTSQRLMQAGDANEIDLPIGNKILGLLLRSFTFPTAASRNASFAENRIEVDNVEVGYSRTLWEGIQGEMGRLITDDWAMMTHQHTENTAAAYAQNARTLMADQDVALMQQYAYMDFDPTDDLMYAIDTKGAAKVSLASLSDVTDATASRVLPVEYVELTSAP